MTASSVSPGPIAYLTGEYPAVSHTFILREVEALRAMGHDVITCAIRQTPPSQHPGPAEKRAAASTFYVLRAAKSPARLLGAHLRLLTTAPGRYMGALRLAWRTRPPGLKALAYQLFYLAEAGVLARHLQHQNARHLHNHFGDSSCSVAMLAAHLANIPFSFTMHGPTEFFEAHKWALGEKAARARFVACISHFCRSQVMAFCAPADWDKLPIVHCGVDPDRYGRADRAPGQKGQELVFVGRLAGVKGVPVLIEAMAEVLRHHPETRLTLVGDGPERATIEARIAALGLGHAVEITGYLSQDGVAERLSRSDIFVLPSFAEGVPVVLMEAMATGLPVVTTRIAGIPELVEHGVSGHVVPPGSVSHLAKALIELLEDPDTRTTMGAAGQAKVRAEFESRTEAAKLAQAID